jgi:hypothetical protein
VSFNGTSLLHHDLRLDRLLPIEGFLGHGTSVFSNDNEPEEGWVLTESILDSL